MWFVCVILDRSPSKEPYFHLTRPPPPTPADTEGAFTAGRAAEMAQALIDHLRRIVKGGKATPEQQREVEVGGWVLSCFTCSLVDDNNARPSTSQSRESPP